MKTEAIIKDTYSAYHLFVIEVSYRNSFMRKLNNKGIQTLIHYPVPIHLQECYRYLGYKKGDYPITEKVSDRLVSIPIYPELNENEIKFIISIINNYQK